MYPASDSVRFTVCQPPAVVYSRLRLRARRLRLVNTYLVYKRTQARLRGAIAHHDTD